MSKKTATILLGTLVITAVAVNVIWISLDQSPPLWDIAGHANRSAYFAQLLQQGEFKAIFNFQTIYPPFTYLVTALFFLSGGWSALVPGLSLLPFLILFILSTYSLTFSLFQRRGLALAATALSLAYPLLAHFTRIYDLDFPLVAMTTAAIAAMVKTNHLTERWWVVGSAVAIALAILTKWTAVLFVAVPFIWELAAAIRSKVGWKKLVINLAILVGLVLAIALPWYLVHGREIYNSSIATRNNVFSVPFENLWSWGNISFYADQTIRGITWPLSIAFVIGLICLGWKYKKQFWYLLLVIIIPYLFLTLALYSKESRYFLPVFPLLAAVTVGMFLRVRSKASLGEKRPHGELVEPWLWISGGALAAVAAIFWLQTSFGVPIISRSARDDLQLTNTYGLQDITTQKPFFGFTYPITYQSNVPEIADELKTDIEANKTAGETVKVAVVPNSIFLSGQPVEFYTRLNGVNRPGGNYRLDFSYSSKVRGRDWRDQIVSADYLITKTGDQGPAIWGPALNEVRDAEKSGDLIFTENFEQVKTWTLRGIEGEEREARLYRLISNHK